MRRCVGRSVPTSSKSPFCFKSHAFSMNIGRRVLDICKKKNQCCFHHVHPFCLKNDSLHNSLHNHPSQPPFTTLPSQPLPSQLGFTTLLHKPIPTSQQTPRHNPPFNNRPSTPPFNNHPSITSLNNHLNKHPPLLPSSLALPFLIW